MYSVRIRIRAFESLTLYNYSFNYTPAVQVLARLREAPEPGEACRDPLQDGARAWARALLALTHQPEDHRGICTAIPATHAILTQLKAGDTLHQAGELPKAHKNTRRTTPSV